MNLMIELTQLVVPSLKLLNKSREKKKRNKKKSTSKVKSLRPKRLSKRLSKSIRSQRERKTLKLRRILNNKKMNKLIRTMTMMSKDHLKKMKTRRPMS